MKSENLTPEMHDDAEENIAEIIKGHMEGSEIKIPEALAPRTKAEKRVERWEKTGKTEWETPATLE